MTNTSAPQPGTRYEDARKTTTGKDKAASGYRVFVEQDGKTTIVAYKKTQRAAVMLFNKIGREHDYSSGIGWSYGWETKDKYNETNW